MKMKIMRFMIEEAGPDSDRIWEIRMNQNMALCQGRCCAGRGREEYIHGRKSPIPNGA